MADDADVESKMANLSTKQEDPTLWLDAAGRPLSKAAKRRKKKMLKEKARKEAVAAELANATTSARDLEDEALQRKLAPLGLQVHSVAADGHCLYRAIADQIKFRNVSLDAKTSLHFTGGVPPYLALRRLAADTMRVHRDQYLPFLSGLKGDPLTQDQFLAYTTRVAGEGDGVAWGGAQRGSGVGLLSETGHCYSFGARRATAH